MGDAISHAVLPGIVLAYIAGLPLAIGAFVAGLVLRGRHRLHQAEQPDQGGHRDGRGLHRTCSPSGWCCSAGRHRTCTSITSWSETSSASPAPKSGRPSVLGGVVLGVTLAPAPRPAAHLLRSRPGAGHGLAGPVPQLPAARPARRWPSSSRSRRSGIILVVAMLVTPGSIAHLWTDRFDRMLAHRGRRRRRFHRHRDLHQLSHRCLHRCLHRAGAGAALRRLARLRAEIRDLAATTSGLRAAGKPSCHIPILQ